MINMPFDKSLLAVHYLECFVSSEYDHRSTFIVVMLCMIWCYIGCVATILQTSLLGIKLNQTVLGITLVCS